MTLRVEDLIVELNADVLAGFSQTYQTYTPALDSLAWTYSAEGVKSVHYLFNQFMNGLQKFTGQRKYDSLPDVFKMAVTNKTWDKGVLVAVDDLEEAARISEKGKIQGLDPYKQAINSLSSMAKDHPFDLMITAIENGTSTTPLSTVGIGDTVTGIDGQALFATTHSYASVAGTQSNIVSGSGTTIAQLEADLLSAMSRFAGFYFLQSGTDTSVKSKKKLNKVVTRVRIHCPVELFGLFTKLKNTNSIAIADDNTVKTLIADIQAWNFADANDWYIELLDTDGMPMMRPFINQIRKQPKLDLPSPDDESVKENDAYKYGVRYKGMVGIGAWWKLIKVTNA